MKVLSNYNNINIKNNFKPAFKGVNGIVIKGLETSAKIYAKEPAYAVYSRVKDLCNHPAFRDAHIRLMPDVHPSSCTLVGLSADFDQSHAIPGIISGDIGCGMLCVSLGKTSEKQNYTQLDDIIKTYLSGKRKHEPVSKGKHIRVLDKVISSLAKKFNVSSGRMIDDLGTVGGGNHFIEIDKDAKDNLYMLIHSGSRSMGSEVYKYYSKIAQSQNPYKIRELSFLSPSETAEYVHDMSEAIKYSAVNRRIIADEILRRMGWIEKSSFESIHNYIDTKGIIRKGAINAEAGKDVVIPLNMRDGAILGKGKGNPEWNCTAPHGAGRQFSRSEASQLIGLDEYKEAMKGIHTSCVSEHTLDESPFAYKNAGDIIDGISDTVDIKTIIKPTFNYKD